MKRLHAAHLGQDVVIGGRRRPTSYARRLTYAMLRPTSLPARPKSTSYETPAMTALRQMLLNNALGDCVIAGRGHRIGVLTANAGSPFVYTDAMALAEYERIGKYNPSDPTTDQGCVMSDAADDGVVNGYADGSHDAGWIDVDATDREQVMEVIYLFECGDLGMELPDAWIQNIPTSNDFVWDVAGPPNPENGHCIQIVDFDEVKGARIATWGLLGWLTWEALAKYSAKANNGELIVHISKDEVRKVEAKAPNSFDWSTLVGYFDAMGGHVAMPSDPTPPPPTPPVLVTLDQAQAWAKAGIARGGWLQLRGGAERLALQGLSDHWPRP